MKRRALYLIAVLIVAFGSCKKTNTGNQQQLSLLGGWSLGAIVGYNNISLPKNTDTTINMPITVGATIHGNWDVGITINFNSLPADIVSVTPASYSGTATTLKAYVTDTFAFHIHAIDTGTFPIAVIANDGGGVNNTISDTFKLLVH